MQLIHGSYIPESGFWLWGEGIADDEKSIRGKWPHAINPGSLTDLLKRAFHLQSVQQLGSFTAWFPSLKGRAIPSSPLLGEVPEASSAFDLQAWLIPAALLRPGMAIDLLSGIQEPRLEPGIFCAQDLLYWSSLARFALRLVVQQKYIPALRESSATWRAVLLGEDRTRFEQYEQNMPPVCRAVTATSGKAPPAVPAENIALRFLEYLIHATVMEAKLPPVGERTPHDRWLASLLNPGASHQDLAELQESILQWTAPLLRRASFGFRLAFRLEEPTRKRESWLVRYFLQKETDPTLLIPLEKLWKVTKSVMHILGDSMQLAIENTLVSLSQSGKIDPYIEMSLQQAQPSGYQTDAQGAWEFLNVKAWILQDAGFGVLLPSWWGRKQTPRLGLRAKAKGGKKAFRGGGSDLVIDFDWKLAIGKEEISYQELMSLAKLKVPLIKFRGKWMELRPDQIQAAQEFWKSKDPQQGNLSDLLKLISGAEMEAGLPVTEVEATGWVSQFLHQFHTHASYKLVPAPATLTGKLREYQQRGFSWLHFLKTYRLGACLADDMGLGKTIQSIALLLKDKEDGAQLPVLLICPTSVVGNWEKELEKFAPSLRVLVHHGISRKKGMDFSMQLQDMDLVLSSYSLMLRDIGTIGELRWRGVILDEAQNIKNAETKQARAARSLQADFRIALTGTPVENNIGELWSIFEFLNPGLLGTRSEFKERFFNPIHTMNNPDAAEALQKITAPFLLRRLKTDPEIAGELSSKLEMKTYCNLTTEQASLYAAAVKALEKDLDNSEGIERKGKILASITKLKQICNHPAQFLKDGSPLPGRSGKLARISEMLEEVMEVGERVLIFSQFVEMGDLLRQHLQEYFGKEVLFLHGGVTRLKREEMIRRFQEDPDGPAVFLLSLKAGGTGLNLTAANHVFHFDRWWNPAVEDQATDRAFRIGQKKNVQVHKMICVGTLEERIDQMIEKKKSIARSIIGTGEAWLTELSTSELKALVALGKEAVSV